MRQKEIEKIPFLPLVQCKSDKKYLVMAEIKVIGGEDHLLLDIYSNKKKKQKQPVIRLAYTKKDWGIYWPEEENRAAVWSRSSLRDEYGRNRWESFTKTREGESDISEENKKLIYDFTGEKYTDWTTWSESLQKLENSIKYERKRKREDRAQKELEERHQGIVDLPEHFETWYKKDLFYDTNFLFYKRQGKYVDLICSHCGEEDTQAIKRTESYEGQFESIIETPVRNGHGTCQRCGARGIYKPSGTTKGVYGIKRGCYVGQRHQEDGFLVRYFEIEKMISMNGPERFSVIEVARNFFQKEKKLQKDYHLCSNWSGKTFWSNTNLGGNYNIVQPEAEVYPGTYTELKGTFLQYSALREWTRRNKTVELVDYLQAYLWHPYLELLVKAGMDQLVERIVECRMGELSLKEEARKPEDLFRIRKQRLGMLIESKGDLDLLKLLQIEKETGNTWKKEEIEKLLVVWPSRQQLMMVLELMSLTQYLNRVERYAQADWNGCSQAASRLKGTSTTYLDYLNMRRAAGYDMSNTIYLYPKNLDAAHNKMVEETLKEEMDQRIQEVEDKFPDIRKKYRTNRKRYYFEDETFCIRPAKSAGEIVKEGRLLHHCVGGDSYLRNHNEGKRYVLLLRDVKTPSVPYITVEIEAGDQCRILQWYGAYDKKPDQAQIQKWLDAYVTRLKCSSGSAEQLDPQETNQQIRYA